MRTTAVVLQNNELILDAVKKTLERAGFKVRQDIESCRNAAVAFVGSYFALLGVLKQMRAVNPALPLVLIVNADDGWGEGQEIPENIFDVITTHSRNESEVSENIERWLSNGKGRPFAKGVCEGNGGNREKK